MGHNGVLGDNPILYHYPLIWSDEKLTEYFKSCFTAKGTSGKIQIQTTVKGYNAIQSHSYLPPLAEEPTGPTEVPSFMVHPRSQNKPVHVRPNRLRTLYDGKPWFVREIAPRSLDQPSFWDTKADFVSSILVTIKWEWPENQQQATITTSIQ